MNPELIFAADADSFGSGRRSLALQCRAGQLVRLRAGIYIDVEVWRQLRAWEKERVRIQAASQQVPGQRVLVQQSAAVIWGLPVIDSPPEVLLLASPSSHGRRRGGLHWTERKLLEPLDVVEGMSLTSRAQTALDMAAYLAFEHSVPAMDSVLRPDLVHGRPATNKDELEKLARNLPDMAKQTRARRVIDFADPRSESPGESYSRAVLHRHGFPVPGLQYEFLTSLGRFRTDFYWKDKRVVGEFDVAVKYGANGSVLPPSWDTLMQEKRREDAIRATGVAFVRWSWRDIRMPAQHPESLVHRLIQAGLSPTRRQR
ncbi:hypothetical protein LJ756_12205 [Arthrobacter sp. zg-Y411]|uniref:hypothetical protein n=1 Tax=Arthrobacter zhangbolii TaxID=2886936 RepID=UPI001D146CF8|nr:hypothetical protein [Arthrobacter zhangbolii]MCC3295383.1 hypothetical protein [Arthrobacter zhangbolii]